MRRLRALFPVLLVAIPALIVAAVLWTVHAAAMEGPVVEVALSDQVPAFTPRVVLAQQGQTIVIANNSSHTVLLTSAPHAPSAIRRTIPAGGSARISLHAAGTYHFYDAAVAHVIDYTAGNDVVRATPAASRQDLPGQGWIVVPPAGGVPLNIRINVPSGQDLMDPLVVLARVGGSVTVHNFDTDPHNLVTDAADPTGIAFELLGTDDEPAIHGAERRITFTVPGLYHVYCSIHTVASAVAGGWQVVQPRSKTATGYADHNPMEAWFLVIP